MAIKKKIPPAVAKADEAAREETVTKIVTEEPQADVKPERKSTVRIGLGLTIQAGDFEPIRADIAIEEDVANNTEIEELGRKVYRNLKFLVKGLASGRRELKQIAEQELAE